MPRKNTGIRVGAGCLIVSGLPLLVAALGLFSTREIGGGITFLLLGAFLCVGAIVWLKNAAKREKIIIQHYEEKQVLNIAAANGGTTTILEVTQMTQMDVSQAEAAILRLCGSGQAHSEIQDDGTVLFSFAGLRLRQ